MGNMFSQREMIVFGIAMVSFVLATIVLFFIIEGATKFLNARNERDRLKHRAERTYKVERTDFEELATAALRHQRMLSFETETSTGRIVEFTVDEILEELKERKK